MELWIRSQDKELLVLAKGFELQNPSYNGGCQIFAVWQNNYQCVGNYKSKQRALEILDKIQKNIELQGKEFLDLENGGYKYGNVYEMPEE